VSSVNFRGPSREADGNLFMAGNLNNVCTTLSRTPHAIQLALGESKKGSSLSHGHSLVLTTVRYQFN